MSKYKIGDKVSVEGKEFYICGLSTMVYDEDCEGEPEWKVTREVKEVAIVEPFVKGRHHEFHKPLWVRVEELL